MSPRPSSAALAAALAVVMLAAVTACASIEDSPAARELRAAESHNPPGNNWLPSQDKDASGRPWGGCPDSYDGWC
ncbi:MAG: hypothetical protein ACM3N5_15200 [Candidatus Eiseniibacteriota bacterium]